MVDAHKNFAISLVATAPSPATTGTSLVVTAAGGALFPAVPFNAVIWPAGAAPTAANAEIVRVTNISTDTFTITRTQESTSARTVVVGDQIAAAITALTLTDVENALARDTLWAAKGDLAAGTAADTAAILTVGADDTILMADAAAATGLKWVASASPSTQAFGDAAATGTGDTFTRGDHKHAMPAIATQTTQEATSNATQPVVASVQQHHPSAAKFWATANSAGSILASYNLTSITDGGTGLITFTIATNFSSADWVVTAAMEVNTTTEARGLQYNTQTNTAVSFQAVVEAGGDFDPVTWGVAGFGDQ